MVVQWLRFSGLSVQEALVPSLVRELDPVCCV